MDEFDIKNLTLDYLKKTPEAESLKHAFATYEKAQMVAMNLINNTDQQDLALTKIGTVLSLNLFGTLLSGKKAKNLTQDDWKKITNEVIDKAVLTEDRDYSIYVFDLYADYIDTSAKVLGKKATKEKDKDKIKAIKALSKDLRNEKKQLEAGSLTETEYVENCMWISLDAMIKCMATYIGCFTSEEIGELVLAASSFAFEYGRLKLYRQEQALLESYLKNQYVLDEQMQIRFNAFQKELEEEAARFKDLLGDAFDPDFRKALSGSAELARNVGVEEKEILKSLDEVDDFFLS